MTTTKKGELNQYSAMNHSHGTKQLTMITDRTPRSQKKAWTIQSSFAANSSSDMRSNESSNLPRITRSGLSEGCNTHIGKGTILDD